MEITPSESEPAVEAIDGVHLAQVASGEGASLQQFRIEPGATVHVHDHHHEQIGWLAEGELVFTVGDGGREMTVEAGDAYVIPGGEPHGAENRGAVDAVGVEAFAPARARPPWETPAED